MMKNGVLILRKAHFLNCIPCARHWPMLFTSIISSYSHSAPMRQALLSSFFYMQGCWSWDLLKVTQQVSGNKWHSLSDLRTILLESLCPPPKMMHYISSSVLQLIIIYARQTNPSVILYFHIYHSVMSDSLRPHELQHTRLPCLSLSPRVAQTHVCEAVMPSNHPILAIMKNMNVW